MRTRVTVVCLFVCYQSTDCLRDLHIKMNILAGFTLDVEDFQLRDFFKTLSFKTYSFIWRAKAAIFFFIRKVIFLVLRCLPIYTGATRSLKFLLTRISIRTC